MGCGSSKVDDSLLIALCRERASLIASAADLRYSMAESHASYLRSLASLGDAIHTFALEELAAAPPSPAIALPPETKSRSDGSGTSLSHSLSNDDDDRDGGHIQLSSDSEPESVKSSSLKSSSPLINPSYGNFEGSSSNAIPSMTYQNPYAWDYNPYYNYPMRSPARDPPAAEVPPPPPPAGGSAWDFFNFFDSYEQYLPNYPQGNYYGVGSGSSSSTNSSEVRAREGIPDLEDETEQEILTPLKKGKKIMGEDLRSHDFGEGTSKAMRGKEKNADYHIDLEHDLGSRSISESTKESSIEVKEGRSKDKEVILEEERPMAAEESGLSNADIVEAHGTRDVVEVAKEIKQLFKSAAACGEEVSRKLEVGKVKYRSRSRLFRVVSFRILRPMGLSALASSWPFKYSKFSVRRTMKNRGNYAAFQNRIGMKSGNLSSTLEKLAVWERRLYKEVKGEEKLRLVYEKKCRRLRYLDNRGTESHKIDSTRDSIRQLHMKLSIVIRSVDVISRRMHKIRDDELQPQLIELMKGLIKMWKSMFDYHQKQFRVILDTKNHHLTAKTGVHGHSFPNITKGLEVQLINWCSNFQNWINAQKSYVEAFNEWLMKWLPQGEETDDGFAPLSPGSIEAPLVFIVSNDWNDALKGVSESEVMTSMHNFALIVHRLWEIQDEEQRQKLKIEYLSRAYDRKRESLRIERGTNGESLDVMPVTDNGRIYRDDAMMELELLRKEIDTERRKNEETVTQLQEVASNSLKTGLIPIFEALVDFSSEMVKAYERVRIRKENGGS